MVNGLPSENDFPAEGMNQAHDGFHGCRFSRSISSEEATSSPVWTSRETSQRTWTGPYLVETLRSSNTVLPPQIGLDNPLVMTDLLRKTLGNLFPVVEDDDAIRGPHDHFHIVLDKKNRYSQTIPDLFDETGDSCALVGFIPAVGSSKRRSFGSETKARAISSRLRLAKERVSAKSFRRGSRRSSNKDNILHPFSRDFSSSRITQAGA